MIKYYSSFIIFLILFGSCATESTLKNQDYQPLKTTYIGYQNPIQTIAPEHFKSISLKGVAETSIPILTMNSNQTLSLRFDEITNSPSNLGIRFSRYTQEWESDGFVSTQISTGQLEDLITGYERSDADFPTFYQFEYTFPNDQIQFKISGNWLVEVFDYTTGTTQFSLPFFLTEQSGKTEISYETLNEFGQESRYQHQFFTEYYFPNSLQLPEFNLSVFTIQDGMYSGMKKLDIIDLSERNNGFIRFHHPRSNLFLANVDFQRLDLRRFKENQQVRFVEEVSNEPIRIELYDDNPSFEQTTSYSIKNNPSFNRFDRYGLVRFSFIPNWEVSPNEQIYVTGSFNQWALKPETKLTWSDSLKRFTTQVLLKQGTYAYTYEVVQNSKIKSQRAQNPMGLTQRVYATLVYYKDPILFTDRLLMVKEVYTK